MSIIPNISNTLGKNFERLTGKDNYRDWLQRFEPIARLNGVYGFYDGTDAIVEQPSHTTVFPDRQEGRTSRDQAAANDAAEKAAKENLTWNLAKYNLALDQWKDNDKRVRLALAILQNAVEPYVWQEIEEEDSKASTNPRRAWKALTSINEPSRSVTLQRALQQLTTLKLADYNNVREYVLAANRLRAEVKAAQGEYPNNQMITTILNGLTPRYNSFVDHILLTKDIDSFDNPQYKAFTETLVKFADDHKVRWDEQDKARNKKNGKGKNGNSSSSNDTNNNSKNGSARDPRTCFFCGFRGHIEAECRKKKQAIIDQGTDNPTKPEPPQFNRSNKSTSSPNQGDNKPHVGALAAAAGNDNDGIEHIAAMSLYNDYIQHSNPPCSYPTNPSPCSADALQSEPRPVGQASARGGQVTGLQALEQRETVSVCSNHRSPISIALLNNEHKSMPQAMWAADTAATTHICNDKSLFTTFTTRSSSVGSCDNAASLSVLGVGSVDLTMRTRTGRRLHVTLSDVAYAPNSRCNLLSVHNLMTKINGTYQGDKDQMVLFDSNGKEIGFAPLQHRLYSLDICPSPDRTSMQRSTAVASFLTPDPQTNVAAAAVDFNDEVWRKHRCLGHLSIEGMRRLSKISTGLNLTDAQLKAKILEVCPICATSRALNRIPREPAKRHFPNPGDLIHIDTWGPYPIPGLKGERYCEFYTDDATRFTWVDFLITKDGIPLVTTARLTKIEVAHNIVVRRVRTDNEFVHSSLRDYCTTKGITQEFIVPHAHNQNGVSERVNRTVRERASAQLQDYAPTPRLAILTGRATEALRSATLPEALWTEAIRDSVWKKNRSPTKALKFKKTPYEALTGLQPDLSREQAWGTRVYVTIPPEKRAAKNFSKLHSPRAYPAYYVSTESEQIIRVWDPELQKVSRITAPRIDDGAGMDDPQPGVPLNVRNPEPVADIPEHWSSDSDSDTDNSSQDDDHISDSDASDHASSSIAMMAMEMSSDDEGPNLNNSDDDNSLFFLHHNADLMNDEAVDDDLSNDARTPSTLSEQNLDVLRPAPVPSALRKHLEGLQYNSRIQSPDKATVQVGPRQKWTPAQVQILEDAFNENRSLASGRGAKVAHDADMTVTQVSSWFKAKVNKARLQQKKAALQDPLAAARSRYRRTTWISLRALLKEQDIPIPDTKEDACIALANKEVHGPDAPISNKCWNCYIQGRACTFPPGTSECTTCPARRMKCTPIQEKIDRQNVSHFKCITCQTDELRCNPTQRPCPQCVKDANNCHDYDDLGVLTKYWTTDELPVGLDDCNACLLLKRNCGGFDEGPCFTCSKFKRRTCTYSNIGNNVGKAYLLRSFTWESTDEDIIRHKVPFDPSPSDVRMLVTSFHHTGRHRRGQREANDANLKLMDEDGLDDDYSARDNTLDIDQASHGSPQPSSSSSEHISRLNRNLLSWTQELYNELDPAANDTPEPAAGSIHSLIDPALFDDVLPVQSSNSDAQLPSQEGLSEFGESLDDQNFDHIALVSVNLSDDPIDADIQHYSQRVNDDHVDSDVAYYTTMSTPPTDRTPRNYKEAMSLPDAKEWDEATWKEFDQLYDLGVFEVVELPPGKKAISTKLVYKTKYRPNGDIKKRKARCVARGFLQKKGSDYGESWAGTANATAIRILLALATMFGWKRYQVDIVTAFLYALLQEEVYAKPPLPIKLPAGHVWRLKRALYGLVQSPRAWFFRLKEEMVRLGFRQSLYEPCIYIHTTRKIIISVVVDDLSIYGPYDQDITWFKKELARVFKTTDEDEDSTYLGMQIQRTANHTRLHQNAYAKKILQRFELHNAAPVQVPSNPSIRPTKATTKVNEKIRTIYLQKFGSLNYLPTMTRPDLAYAISMCGRYNANPTQDHMDAIDRVYAYVKATSNVGITYTGQPQEVQGYVDADWVGCLDTRRSTTGWVFTLAGGPISWSSKRQGTVSMSTTEAEYIAATEAVKEALWIKRFINDLQTKYQISSVPIYIDNNSAYKLTQNPEGHHRTKHIDARHHFIRDAVQSGDITMKWISGKENPADMFTKPLPRPALDKIKKDLNIV